MSDIQTLGLGAPTAPRTITIHETDLERVETLVRELALSGTEEFYASYVARELELERDHAHACLVVLGEKGLVETHFNVIHPQTGKTIATYGLGDQIPIDEEITSEGEEFEPFILAQSDVMVAYAVTTDYLRRLLRERAAKRERRVTKGEIYDLLDEIETESTKVEAASRLKVGPKERERARGALETTGRIRSYVEALGSDKAPCPPTTFGS